MTSNPLVRIYRNLEYFFFFWRGGGSHSVPHTCKPNRKRINPGLLKLMFGQDKGLRTPNNLGIPLRPST